MKYDVSHSVHELSRFKLTKTSRGGRCALAELLVLNNGIIYVSVLKSAAAKVDFGQLQSLRQHARSGEVTVRMCTAIMVHMSPS